MRMIPFETLNNVEEVCTIGIGKSECDGHNTIFLQCSVDSVDVLSIFGIIKFKRSNARNIGIYTVLV